jgi:hypothetical protein
LNSTVAGLGNQIEEAFGILTTPLTEGKYSGQDIPKVGTEQTNQGAYTESDTYVGQGGGGRWKPLLDLIHSVESSTDKKNNGYDAQNGSPGGVRPGLSQMTIGEIARNAPGASGRYQQMPQYLLGRAKAAGFNENTVFSPAVQDALAIKLIEGRGGNSWLSGKMRTEDFMQGLADEWAAVPNAYGKFSYRRQSSSLKPERVKAALSQVKSGSSQTQSSQSSQSQPSVVNAGPTQQVSGTWETGKGFNPAGAKDVYGRPVVLSRSAAEAFSAMMRDSKGVVKGTDVASSQRSFEKNARVGGAVRSKHLSGLALDIHGSSNAWMRKYGSRYGWYANDYSGSHGGHFEFRGKSFSQTSTPSPTQVAASQQRQGVPSALTPDRKPQDIMVYQPPSQQNIVATPSGGGGQQISSPISDFDLLNNFMKNKLLLDLAYL